MATVACVFGARVAQRVARVAVASAADAARRRLGEIADPYQDTCLASAATASDARTGGPLTRRLFSTEYHADVRSILTASN